MVNMVIMVNIVNKITELHRNVHILDITRAAPVFESRL